MERPIARKAIDADPQPPESPEGRPLKGSDQNGGTLLDFSGSEDLDSLPSLDDGESEGDSFPKKYSLDEFPESEPPSRTVGEASVTPSSPAKAENGRWGSIAGIGFLGHAGTRMSCLAVLSTLIIASGIGVTVRQYRSTPSAGPNVERKINKTLKHSIKVPNFQEQMELVVLVGGEKEKRLVAMQLQFGFPAENAYQDFQRDIVLYRDLAYQFVNREQPVKNNQKGWQEVIEKKLVSYLRANCPRSGLQSIRIAHWERL